MAKLMRAFGLYANYFVRRRTPTIVYSVERSGSIALFQSLHAHGDFALSTHRLDPAKIKVKRYSGSTNFATRHIVLKGRKAKIISLIRNPIDSIMSFFARSDFRDRAKKQGKAAAVSQRSSIEEVCQQFRDEALESGRYAYHLEWFDTEFKAALGVDVYEHPFNKEAGFVEIHHEPYDILLIRTELKDDQKSKLVSEFLGLKDFEMRGGSFTRSMAAGAPGEEAPYAEKYKMLKSHAKIPEMYLDAIAGSRFASHFFTEESLGAMRQKYGRANAPR
ncbi:MAG: putative capsular polysaccharide synthesis family protein [Pirellulales bacterium]|nr:putative capsular polysaccharide synthesis family protein [Pirellulales bacterium]